MYIVLTKGTDTNSLLHLDGKIITTLMSSVQKEYCKQRLLELLIKLKHERKNNKNAPEKSDKKRFRNTDSHNIALFSSNPVPKPIPRRDPSDKPPFTKSRLPYCQDLSIHTIVRVGRPVDATSGRVRGNDIGR